MKLEGVFPLSMVVWAFFQVPVTMVQSFFFQVDRDLVYGTILGNNRLALILIIVFFYFISLAVIKGKNHWLGLIGLVFLIPTGLGEVKAMFFFFPIAYLLLLWHVRKWVSWKFALLSLLICMSANFMALFLYSPIRIMS